MLDKDFLEAKQRSVEEYKNFDISFQTALR